MGKKEEGTAGRTEGDVKELNSRGERAQKNDYYKGRRRRNRWMDGRRNEWITQK
jgi:hypothetical protein